MRIPTLLAVLSVVMRLGLLSSIPGVSAGGPGGVPSIIPKPASMELRKGVFSVIPGTSIYLESETNDTRRIGEFLSTLLSKSTGGEFPVHPSADADRGGHPIVLSLKAPGWLGAEGYEMLVTPQAIRIDAAQASGLFYGAQTLRQLLPAEIEGKAPSTERIEVPCVYIQDKPRFSWRGLMLDCSRTFLSTDYLKRNLDRMALYKLNVLHLHLTDDQGWRLEIKRYPKLTTVGAHYTNRFGSRGGFYSQQDIRGLVRYARERNVTLVPEIELPGHSIEVLAAYPELACDVAQPKAFEVHPFWVDPSFSPPLCAGKDKVFEMFQDVFSEVMELFPSEFIHVGGDEVAKNNWNQCPKCQARMQAEGMKDTEELQSYFMTRIGKYIASKGRRMIGWDEILGGGLAPGAAVMSWRGIDGGVTAAKVGHDVVMVPNSHCYFDFAYSQTPTEQVYSFDPVPNGLSDLQAQRILGVQGALWTHMADTEKVFDYQLVPRIVALAEVAWSPQQTRQEADFDARLEHHLRRFELLGIKYFDKTSSNRKIGSWQASDLKPNEPRPFDWDVTSYLESAGDYLAQIRRDNGQNGVLVESIAMLEDSAEIGRDDYAAEINTYIDTKVTWFTLAKHKSGSRYTIRVVLQGSNGGGESGSVWVRKGQQ